LTQQLLFLPPAQRLSQNWHDVNQTKHHQGLRSYTTIHYASSSLFPLSILLFLFDLYQQPISTKRKSKIDKGNKEEDA
jgi:hypothetical protein